MDIQHAAVALQSLVALAGLLFIWNVLWPHHVTDTLRQNLFSVRHRLFMTALRGEGGLTFDSPAYQSARASINAFINAAGPFNIWLLLAMALNDLRQGILGRRPSTLGVTPTTTDAQRAALAPTEKAMGVEIAKYLFWRTPLFSTLFGACLAFCLGVVLCYRVAKRVGERRKLFVNPTMLIRTRVAQSMAKELGLVLRHVNEFDQAAPWSRQAKRTDPELVYSER